MMEILFDFAEFGRAALTVLWIPMAVWTIIAIPIYWVSRRLGKKRPALHYYGMVVLLSSLLMGFIMAPVWDGLATLSAAFQTPEVVLPIDETGNDFFFLSPEVPVHVPSVAEEVIPMSPSPRIYLAAFIGGITGLFIFLSTLSLLGLFYKLIRLRTIKKGVVPLVNEQAQDALRAAKRELGIERKVALMMGREEIVPMTFGWRHPVIVLPQGIDKEPAVLKAVLYHELIHVKRNDYLLGIVTHFLSALFIFHPLVWLLDRSIKTYRELSCDNVMLRTRIIAPLNYASLLLRFNSVPPKGYAIPMIQNKSVIKQRIKAMSEFASTSFRVHPFVGLVALGILLFMPAFFMACNFEAETLEEPFVAPEGATVIDDLKLAFMLPEGWWQNGEPVRATSADLVEMITPAQREELEKSDPAMVNGDEDDLQTALYMYMYNNLPTSQDSIPENFEDVLFSHFLTMNLHTYFSKSQLFLWAKGRCAQFPLSYCDEKRNPESLELIRVLGPDENPFQSGRGFLYRVKKGKLPALAFIYYIVRDGWAYRISYEITENALGDDPYPPLLDTMGFVE